MANLDVAFESFRARFADEYELYHTQENVNILANYVVKNFGDTDTAGAFEIAFRECLSQLTPNPDYASPQFRKQLAEMSSSEVNRKYRNDAEFRKQCDAAERADRAAHRDFNTESDPYCGLTATDYLSMPNETKQRLFQTSTSFKNAVQNLVDKGQLTNG